MADRAQPAVAQPEPHNAADRAADERAACLPAAGPGPDSAAVMRPDGGVDESVATLMRWVLAGHRAGLP